MQSIFAVSSQLLYKMVGSFSRREQSDSVGNKILDKI